MVLVSAALGKTPARTPPPIVPVKSAVTATLESGDLRSFARNPPAVRHLIEECLALTRQNLTYRFGSADPSQGGMDCSGTIFYVLTTMGVDDVPRTASEQYVWVRKKGKFETVISRRIGGFEFDRLRPGDLLFWTGTYATANDPPVTHTMIYLGRRKSDGHRVMFGSSDGRSYDGRRMWGVSVFDFTLPAARAKEGPAPSAPGSTFIGYARVPGLRGVTSSPSSRR